MCVICYTVSTVSTVGSHLWTMEYFCDPAAAVRCKFQRFKTKMLFVCFLDRNQGPGNQNGKKREEVAKDGFCLAGKMLLEEKEDYSSREEGKDTVKVCFAGVFCVGACCDRRKGGDRGDFPCESAGILSGRVGFSVWTKRRRTRKCIWNTVSSWDLGAWVQSSSGIFAIIMRQFQRQWYKYGK